MCKINRSIQTSKSRELIDWRRNTTVEAVVILEDGSAGRAAVPSGASTGSYEKPEVRDNDPSRYLGKGVQLAVEQVKTWIAPALTGKSVLQQQEIDRILCELIDPKSG